jgi:type I restriction enzyme M protein
MAPELAQYFTPQPVAAFALDALMALGLRPGRLRAIDPACGEGVFLLEAGKRLPEAELWGCDLDEGLRERWRSAGLDAPRARLLVQDGLLDAPLFGVGAGMFGLVVGNPPYGLGMLRPATGEPIEAQFLRRFVLLAEPGGWLAIVVPEGIVANARSQPLRDWLLERAALKAVIALPESTFAAAGTRARTMLLLARKQRGEGGEVLLAARSAGGGDEGALSTYLAEVLEAIRGRAEHVPTGRRGRAR